MIRTMRAPLHERKERSSSAAERFLMRSSGAYLAACYNLVREALEEERRAQTRTGSTAVEAVDGRSAFNRSRSWPKRLRV
jgi:hypothetical protein